MGFVSTVNVEPTVWMYDPGISTSYLATVIKGDRGNGFMEKGALFRSWPDKDSEEAKTTTYQTRQLRSKKLNTTYHSCARDFDIKGQVVLNLNLKICVKHQKLYKWVVMVSALKGRTITGIVIVLQLKFGWFNESSLHFGNLSSSKGLLLIKVRFPHVGFLELKVAECHGLQEEKSGFKHYTDDNSGNHFCVKNDEVESEDNQAQQALTIKSAIYIYF
ncbi:OLC1v1012804C1 [Oldenlandia corymbosa var. corymbosa]|uniref:OLC1v1012804C1 n=1 Tax=Oldenlandia corymbosa var. corymbosa TaxID=529605 RepID=A0AAV1DWQ8_OLDCO|nr:OLC1v1012804C1 [Oldenlandia corymbosa var. corymbosa]